MSTVAEKLWPREFEGKRFVANYLWDTNTLSWIRETTNSGTGTGAEVQVTNFPAVQAVSASSLPLPAGASTAANQVYNTAFISTPVTVTAAATKLPATNLAARKLMTIFNDSGTTIWFGPSGVTSATGSRIPNQAMQALAVGPAIDVYAVRGAGSGTVIVQEYS